MYQWKRYSNRNEVETYGVPSGGNLYVGGGTHPSGESGITMLAFDYQGCYFPWAGKSTVLSNCVYLVNEPGNFEWVHSSNGEHVEGAVKYQGVPAGRVLHNGVMRIGKISVYDRCIYYAYAASEFKALDYEALVYKPHRNDNNNDSNKTPNKEEASQFDIRTSN